MKLPSKIHSISKSINTKLLVFLLPTVFAPLALVAFLSITTIHQQAERAHQAKTHLIQELIKSELNEMKQDIKSKIKMLVTHSDVRQTLTNEFSTPASHQQTVSLLKNIVMLDDQILEIQLSSPRLHVETKFTQFSNDYLSNDYVNSFLESIPSNSTYSMKFYWSEVSQQYQMVFAQKLPNTDYLTNKLSSWVIFRFSFHNIYARLNKISELHDMSFMITNQNLHPIYQSLSLSQLNLDKDIFNKTEFTIDNIEYLASHYTLSTNFLLHSFIKKNRFYGHLDEIKLLTSFTILFSCFFIIIFAYYLVSRLIIKPINQLQHKIKKSESGDMLEFNCITSCGEISDLHNSYASTIKSLAEAKQSLSEIAYYDHLTSLKNKSAFTKHLHQALQESAQELASIFIEISNLRVVNQTYGYNIGDEFLISISHTLTAQIENPDISVYRIGNNVFGILYLHDPCGERAKAFSKKLISVLNSSHMVSKLKMQANAYTSIALGFSFEDPIHVFERIEYAKEKALNSPQKYVFFDTDLNRQFKRQSEIRKSLIPAINRKDFMINYQPFYHIDTKEIAGCEALIRWTHPSLGFIGPDEFIPIAEKLGLIFDIDLIVADLVCHYISQLPTKLMREIKFCINASASELGNIHYPKNLISILDKYDISPMNIEIEFTETAFIEINKESQSIVNELRSLGLSIALDDFGTGFTSLNQLVRLNIDKVKIDREHTMLLLKQDSSFVDLIINIGEQFHFSITAEGIEEECQWNYLQQRGCTYGQGYFMSKPLTEKNFTALLNESQPILMSI